MKRRIVHYTGGYIIEGKKRRIEYRAVLDCGHTKLIHVVPILGVEVDCLNCQGPTQYMKEPKR